MLFVPGKLKLILTILFWGMCSVDAEDLGCGLLSSSSEKKRNTTSMYFTDEGPAVQIP